MGLSAREGLAAALGFLVLGALFCGPLALFRPHELPFDHGDAFNSYIPYMVRSYHPETAVIAGPWDATLWTGLPESHSPFGRYYPPSVLLFSLLPLGLAMKLFYVVHLGGAGLGTYLLVRSGGLSRHASVLAGIVFAFGAFMPHHRGYPPMLETCAWLPWVFWSLEMFRRRRTLPWLALTTTLLALQALGAHSQNIVMAALMWVIYAVYFTVCGAGTLRSRLTFGAAVLGACFLGALGSLPQILPMAEVGSWTTYKEPSWKFYLEGSFDLRYISGLAGPWVLGGNFGVRPLRPAGVGRDDCLCYFGLLPLALVTIGLGVAWRRWRQPANEPEVDRGAIGFWLLLLVVNVLLLLGRRTPLYRLLFYLPVYNVFHIPARHLWIAMLPVAWLAGFGFDHLRRMPAADSRRVLRLVAGMFVALAAYCAAAIALTQQWNPGPSWTYLGFWIPVATALAVMLLLTMTCRAETSRPLWLTLLVVVTFTDLVFSNSAYFYSPRNVEELVVEQNFPPAIRWLRERGADTGLPRCLIQKEALGRGTPGAQGSTWGLSVLNTYSQSMPRSLGQLMRLSKYGDTRFEQVLFERRGLSALGGRFIVMHGPARPTSPQVGFVEQDATSLPWQTSGKIKKAIAEMHPDSTYFVEGELAGRPTGPVRLKVIDGFRDKALAVFSAEREDFPQGAFAFAQVLPRLPHSEGLIPVRFEMENGSADVELRRFHVWCLDDRYSVDWQKVDPAELAQRVKRPGPDWLVERAADSGVTIYENPHARRLATLVREVRPAASDQDAAAAMLRDSDTPVTDLAFVVQPPGHTSDLVLSGPRKFASGKADITAYRADDITVKTATPGEGFLVLTVTRCKGWSATVDGQPATLHAVDGPLMGVVVPMGEHTVRFRFDPVLVWAGSTIAVLTQAGVWVTVLFVAWRGLRRLQPMRNDGEPLPALIKQAS